MDCCQGKDDPALLTQFRHNAFDSPKNAVAHSHACSVSVWSSPLVSLQA
jgi:hypothetical protein